MSPSQQQRDTDLLKQVTSRYTLNAAWQYVRPRLESSHDAKIRADAAKFASNSQRSVIQLQAQLRSGTFKFERQKGVLKPRKNAAGEPPREPRPIVVAPAKNRIVQRAILNICQSDNKATRRKLGKLVEIIDRKTSVGGLPNRGTPEAIALITKAISNGAAWYVRSDLKDFFQAVSKDTVQQFLEKSIRDKALIALFMEALKTELENEDEVRDLMRLFPLGSMGVPQGSSLSALCANIVLSDFDVKFNDRGITTIRYLDDFVMLGKSKKSTEAAFRSAESLLAKQGFKCHSPFDARSSKASSGEISNGFEFLSFDISPQRILPTRAARADFIEDIKLVIKNAKSGIQAQMNNARRAQPQFVQTLSLLDRKIRGWGDAFKPTTDRLTFSQLDQKVGEQIDGFQHWFAKLTRNLNARQRRRAFGLALLVDTPVGKTSETLAQQ